MVARGIQLVIRAELTGPCPPTASAHISRVHDRRPLIAAGLRTKDAGFKGEPAFKSQAFASGFEVERHRFCRHDRFDGNRGVLSRLVRQDQGDAEAHADEAVARARRSSGSPTGSPSPGSSRHRRGPRGSRPRVYTVRIVHRRNGIVLVIIPIRTPLPRVPVHVVKTKRIRLQLAHPMSLASSAPNEPAVLPKSCVVAAEMPFPLAACPARILPLRLRGQAIRPPRRLLLRHLR